jgi:2-polyprenyl-6-methoxyphenol hydroxylase-like FAD-dependent oxidoreductase
VRWPAEVLLLGAAGWGRRFADGLDLLLASRELIEWCVRRRVAALHAVQLLEGCEATGLAWSADRAVVSGVRLRHRGRAGDSPDALPVLPADLVVDASGRDSHAAAWLLEAGYGPTPELRINAHLGYASRYLAVPPAAAALDWRGMLYLATPEHPRGGALFPIEGRRWLVTLSGYARTYPPTDEAGFLDYARGLRSPVLYEALRRAEPLSPIRGYRRTENQWRRFERQPRWPERFVVTGDAVCAFNPVYGQGMTAAAQAAEVLDRCLREHSLREHNPHRLRGYAAGMARRFQQQLARADAAIWLLATGEDMRYPATEGARPGASARLVHRYLNRVLAAATWHPVVSKTFLEVAHLLRPPAALFHPRVLLPALVGRGAPPVATPTATPIERLPLWLPGQAAPAAGAGAAPPAAAGAPGRA